VSSYARNGSNELFSITSLLCFREIVPGGFYLFSNHAMSSMASAFLVSLWDSSCRPFWNHTNSQPQQCLHVASATVTRTLSLSRGHTIRCTLSTVQAATGELFADYHTFWTGVRQECFRRAVADGGRKRGEFSFCVNSLLLDSRLDDHLPPLLSETIVSG
jgi:hypothetical protein